MQGSTKMIYAIGHFGWSTRSSGHRNTFYVQQWLLKLQHNWSNSNESNLIKAIRQVMYSLDCVATNSHAMWCQLSRPTDDFPLCYSCSCHCWWPWLSDLIVPFAPADWTLLLPVYHSLPHSLLTTVLSTVAPAKQWWLSPDIQIRLLQ